MIENHMHCRNPDCGIMLPWSYTERPEDRYCPPCALDAQDRARGLERRERELSEIAGEAEHDGGHGGHGSGDHN